MGLGVSLTTATPPDFYSQRFGGFVFPAGTLVCVVCLTPQLFLPVYLHANVGPPSPVAAASPALVSHLPPCHVSSPPGLPVSTTLDECFFFSSLVVGLPYSLILWQFWLFFVFKLVVVLLLVVRGGKVYLPTPLSSKCLRISCF